MNHCSRKAEMITAESNGSCCATILQFIVNTLGIESLVICRAKTWQMRGIYIKQHVYFTPTAPFDICPHWNTPTKPISLSFSFSLQLKPQFTHIIIAAADQRPFTASCRRQRRPCVCFTAAGSVKQWLNLCKQALAMLRDCLPTVWAGAWRGLIPWHGHESHMLMCMCVSVHAEDPSCRIKTRPGRRFKKAPTNEEQRLPCLTSTLHTTSWILLRDDGQMFLDDCLTLHRQGQSWSYITSVCRRLSWSVRPLTLPCCSVFA